MLFANIPCECEHPRTHDHIRYFLLLLLHCCAQHKRTHNNMATVGDRQRRKFDVKFKQQVLPYAREHSRARIPYRVQVVNDEHAVLDDATSGG